MRPFAVIVLAAGASRRLGRPKQLLAFGARTLVEHAASVALDAGATETIVVLGASAETIAPHLTKLPVQVVVNPDWEEGMSSSIRCGVQAVRPDIESAVLTLVDQPFVTSAHLRSLGDSSATVTASAYGDVLGAPCAFRRSDFDSLLALRGDVGARALLRREGVVSIPLEGAGVDVDTEEDYWRLKS